MIISTFHFLFLNLYVLYIVNTSLFTFYVVSLPEITNISSSESSESSGWDGYFPSTYTGSVRTKEEARRKKAPKPVMKPESSKTMQDHKKGNVLGLPNKQFAKDNGIKTWQPKKTKD